MRIVLDTGLAPGPEGQVAGPGQLQCYLCKSLVGALGMLGEPEEATLCKQPQSP